MARTFLTPINMSGLEVQNVLAQSLASDPGTFLTAGRYYYNSTSTRLKLYNGGWVTLAHLEANTFNAKQTLAAVTAGISGSLNIPSGSGNTPVSGDMYNLSGALMWHNGTAAKTIAYTDSNITGTAANITGVLLPANGGTGIANNAAMTVTGVGNYAYTRTLTGVTNVTFPTTGTLANTAYVDNAVAGLSWKEEVRAATAVAGTLASSFANASVIDGVTLATNDRILIKDQAAGAENGIYIVQASGAPVRATDADTAAEIAGAALCVMNGTANAGIRFILSTSGAITLGTTALVFAVFGGGTSYTAGNGLTLATTTFNVGAGTGITVNADDVAIDTSVVVRKFVQATHASTASIAVTHNLNTRNVTCAVMDNVSYAEIMCDVVHTDLNNVTFTFATAPTANAYSFIIHG